MLTPATKKKFSARNQRFAIVASQYNAKFVDGMLGAAGTEFRKAGIKSVRLVRVPGAYEIPVVAAALAHGARQQTKEAGLDAIVCLGVILRGETTHAQHIGEAVSRALMEIQLRYEMPVIHEVLLLENV